VLTAAGALVALASVLLATLLALQGVDLGFPSDLLAAVLYYLMGAFAVWQRPQLLAARRLLLAGVLYVGDMTVERLLSLIAARSGSASWFWVGNALDQALQLAVLCALLALFAVFPDGMYQRRYERRLVWLSWVLVPTLPLFLLVTRPTLFINSLKERVGELDELLHALREVVAGRSAIEPRVVELLVSHRARLERSSLSLLSPRELDVLRQMAEGKTNRAIAEALMLSEWAVEKHSNAIFSKLSLSEEPQVHRRVAAVLAYLRDVGR
jgi:DNA-binding CsgD family transcriptional regulator